MESFRAMMMLTLVLASVLVIAEGEALLPSHFQLLHHYDQHPLPQNLLNDVQTQHPSPKFLRNMVDRDHELMAMETYRVKSDLTATNPGSLEEGRRVTAISPSNPIKILWDSPFNHPVYSTDERHTDVEDTLLVHDTGAPESLKETKKIVIPKLEYSRTFTSQSQDHKKASYIVSRSSDLHQKPHRRQKRFILGKNIRNIAVPLSIFNYLGFLPVRVPGLPYHNDLPSPDYSYYNTMHEVYAPYARKTRRRRKRILF